MDQRLQALFQAVHLTDKKYGKGTTRWIRYLYNGDVQCFTSTDGARNLVSSLHFKEMQQLVVQTLFERICSYLERGAYRSNNDAANYIIDWIGKESLRVVAVQNTEISRLYHVFVSDFKEFESLFGNDVPLEIFDDLFLQSHNKNNKIENVDVIILLLKGLCVYAKGEDLEVVSNNVIDNEEFERVPFLDQDLEQLMNVIESSKKHYSFEKKDFSFPEYLETGNIDIFSLDHEAKHMLYSLNWEIVRLKALKQMFQNMLTYFQSTIPWQLPTNYVIVHFVERLIWEFESSNDISDVFNEVIDNLFANAKRNAETVSYAVDIFVGNIKPDLKYLPKKELEEQRKNVCDYLQRLCFYVEERLNSLKGEKSFSFDNQEENYS